MFPQMMRSVMWKALKDWFFDTFGDRNWHYEPRKGCMIRRANGRWELREATAEERGDALLDIAIK